jgi:hypothetical protein
MIALYAQLLTALYAQLFTAYMHIYIYAVALRGGNTTPSLVADAFCRV